MRRADPGGAAARPDRRRPSPTIWPACAGRWRRSALYLAASHRYRGDDARRLAELARAGLPMRVPLVATNDVLYHVPERRPAAGRAHLHPRALHHRRGRLAAGGQCRAAPEDRPRRWRGCSATIPEALERTVEIAERCRFSLDELRLRIPRGDHAGRRAGAGPAGAADLGGRGPALSRAACPSRCSAARSSSELELIGRRDYAPFFLTVADIVAFASSRGHPVPGPRLGRQQRRLLLPRHHRGRPGRRSTCCSSASSARSATSRPTSTSISSMSGARR